MPLMQARRAANARSRNMMPQTVLKMLSLCVRSQPTPPGTMQREATSLPPGNKPSATCRGRETMRQGARGQEHTGNGEITAKRKVHLKRVVLMLPTIPRAGPPLGGLDLHPKPPFQHPAVLVAFLAHNLGMS